MNSRPENSYAVFPPPHLVNAFCEYHQMTRRERQAMLLICKGLDNRAAAREMKVSEATVRLHLRNIHRKLKTGAKVDLVLKLWQWSVGHGG